MDTTNMFAQPCNWLVSFPCRRDVILGALNCPHEVCHLSWRSSFLYVMFTVGYGRQLSEGLLGRHHIELYHGAASCWSCAADAGHILHARRHSPTTQRWSVPRLRSTSAVAQRFSSVLLLPMMFGISRHAKNDVLELPPSRLGCCWHTATLRRRAQIPSTIGHQVLFSLLPLCLQV